MTVTYMDRRQNLDIFSLYIFLFFVKNMLLYDFQSSRFLERHFQFLNKSFKHTNRYKQI